MGGSPFDKKGGGATATAAPAAAKAPAAKRDDLPDATNLGEDKPISKGDPFAAADPTGIAGYKPGHFMNQLVLLHPTEAGSMKTTANKPGEESEYVRFDVIPLTLPEEFGFTNKYGEYEACEPFEVGERIEDCMFFNKPLVREGKKMLSNGTAWVLGRITKGNRKEGQDAPVILVAGSEEDKALYQEWRNAQAAKK